MRNIETEFEYMDIDEKGSPFDRFLRVVKSANVVSVYDDKNRLLYSWTPDTQNEADALAEVIELYDFRGRYMNNFVGRDLR